MKQLNLFFILIAISFNLFANGVVFKSTSDTVEQYSRLTVNITSTIPFTDPYNSQNISMDAIFKIGADSVILPCFYLSGNSDTSNWQARFAPMKTGQCNYYLKIKTADTSFITASDTFTVVDSSKNGFLSVDPSSFYQFKYSSGKPFRGIGMDLSWEISQLKYEDMFKIFNDRQANFTRIWMCTWNLGVDWKGNLYSLTFRPNQWYSWAKINEPKIDSFRYSQYAIAKMDSMVNLADKYGIYYILTLDFHGALAIYPDSWGGNNFWPVSPFNRANGGTCDNPGEFFYNDTAKKQYKDRLRYMVGRWGYSPSICVWEFWNEVENELGTGNIVYDSINSWQREMAKYLKSIDPYKHMISTTYGYGVFGDPDFTISQIHKYSNLNTITSDIQTNNNSFNKPCIMAEFAYNGNSPTTSNIGTYVSQWHYGIWRGLFSPTPVIPLSWWWDYYYYDNINDFDNLKYISQFSNIISESGTISQIFTPTGTNKLEMKGLLAGSDMFLWLNNLQAGKISNIKLTVSSVTNGTKIF